MANSILSNADLDFAARQRKGNSLIASASLNLTTSFADVIDYSTGTGAWLPVGSAPTLAFIVKWTFSGGTVLTVRPWLTNDDNLVIAAAGYVVRDAGAVATDGLVTEYPIGVKIPKGALSSDNGFWDGASAFLYAPVEVRVAGFRYCKLQVKSDNASGSVIVYPSVGTNE